MSEAAGEAQPEAVELAPSGDAGFAQLMDALVESEAAEEGGAAAPAAGAADGGSPEPSGSPASGDKAAGDGAGGAADAKPGDVPTAGGDAPQGGDKPAAGTPAGDAAGSGDGARPADWTESAEDFAPKLGQLSTSLEENSQKAYEQEALTAVKEEHAPYFAALEKHPRMLVGQKVPRIDGQEGEEILQSTQDARDWQDALKGILVEEVRSRASVKLDENRGFLDTVHASIDLFKNNKDLIPGTKDFDVDLANAFATFAKPYELRVDGKLQGYSVPVQPIIDQLRERVIKDRQSAPAAAPTPAAGASGASAGTPSAAEAPQAGVQSKAGAGGAPDEGFDALFGTIGLSGMRF